MASLEELIKGMNNLKVESANDTVKTSIFCFARMNPPHKGHGKLIVNMIAIQDSLKKQGQDNVDIHIILQRITEPNKNPLNFEQRKTIINSFLDTLNIDKNSIFIQTDYSSQNAFIELKKNGYERFYFIMGDDRRNGFTSPDYKLNGSTKKNMHNTIINTGIQWAKLDNFDNKYFKREDGKHFDYELILKPIDNDDQLETYSQWGIPVIESKRIISIINSRPQGQYELEDLDNRAKKKDVKSFSATNIRKKIQSLKQEQIGTSAAVYRDLVDILLPQNSEEDTKNMIRLIKNSVAVSAESSIMKPAIESRQRRTSSQPLPKNQKSINVLSYNTSWEASQPAVDWMIGPNPYSPPGRKNGIGYMCGRKELYDDVTQAGPFFNGVLKKDKKNRCVENIFDIIQNGNYDLVGMQEYVHTWPYGDDNHPVYSDKMKTLTNMELVKHEVNHRGLKKMIEIASLYNKDKFELIHSEVDDFKIEKFDWNTKQVLPGRHDDGRPVQALLLQDKQDKNYVIFLNAHFPQIYGILNKGSSKERANHVSEIMTKLVQKLIRNSGANNSAVNNNYEIILAADTNDIRLDFVKFIEINGKKMHLGSNLNKKHTCCTHIVKDITINDDWIKGEKDILGNEPDMHTKTSPGRKPNLSWKKGDVIKRDGITEDGVIVLRQRYGDVIMYSGDGEFEYQFPEEKKDEPYSDHAPIAAVLTAPAVSVGGKRRRKKTRKKRKRKRKKTKKRRRKKSTKKKKRRRRRKKTKKRR